MLLLILVTTRRAVAWIAAEAHSVLGSLGWVITGVLAIACIVAIARTLRREQGAPGTARRGRSPAVLALALLALSGGTQMALALAGGRLDRHWESRRLDGVDIYKNHDLSGLVGQCVRLGMLRHRQFMPDGS